MWSLLLVTLAIALPKNSHAQEVTLPPGVVDGVMKADKQMEQSLTLLKQLVKAVNTKAAVCRFCAFTGKGDGEDCKVTFGLPVLPKLPQLPTIPPRKAARGFWDFLPSFDDLKKELADLIGLNQDLMPKGFKAIITNAYKGFVCFSFLQDYIDVNNASKKHIIQAGFIEKPQLKTGTFATFPIPDKKFCSEAIDWEDVTNATLPKQKTRLCICTYVLTEKFLDEAKKLNEESLEAFKKDPLAGIIPPGIGSVVCNTNTDEDKYTVNSGFYPTVYQLLITLVCLGTILCNYSLTLKLFV